MNKTRYNEILDQVYQNYLKTHEQETFIMSDEMGLSRDEFIKKATNNYGFGFLFGITLTRHDLTLAERFKLWEKLPYHDVMDFPIGPVTDEQYHEILTDLEVPVQIVKLTYNNESIEILENTK